MNDDTCPFKIRLLHALAHDSTDLFMTSTTEINEKTPSVKSSILNFLSSDSSHGSPFRRLCRRSWFGELVALIISPIARDPL